MLLLLSSSLAFAQDFPIPSSAWGSILEASPAAAIAFALVYGVWQISAITTRVSLTAEKFAESLSALLREGPNVRLTLGAEERELLERAVQALEDRADERDHRRPMLRPVRDGSTRT